MSERRKFSRISFTGKCSLNEHTTDKTVSWSSELLDISLNGALVKAPQNWPGEKDTPVKFVLQLDGSDITLEISGIICHQEKTLLGVKFLSIDLESISHLKRLVQLNLADENLLNREISQLINADEIMSE